MDYFNISDKEQKKMEKLFSEWIDWFANYASLDMDEQIYVDEQGKTFTVSDYIRDIKTVFGFQSPCKEYFTGAFAMGGKDAVMAVIRANAPLVLRDCDPYNINNGNPVKSA